MKTQPFQLRHVASALFLCAAITAFAQQPGGAGAARTGGNRSGTGATRNYPTQGTIGDAYFSIDPETRRVVTIADEDTSRYISQVLSNLDRPKPQVLIKVVFLEVTHAKGLDIGLEGGWTKDLGDGNTANASHVFGLGALNQAVGTNNPALVNNAVGQPVSSFAQTASTIGGGNAGLYQILGANYQATLRAIAASGNAKILSRPSILARNNQPAQIVVGQIVPLVSGVSYAGISGTPVTTYNYQNVGVILNVTPFITTDGLVEMIVNPQVSSVDFSTSYPITQGAAAYAINTRSANTVAVTPDGQTVILGGLLQDSKSKTETKIPLLGDIPVLGNLFKRQVHNDTQTELMIFLTPHIVQAPSQLAALSASETQKSSAPGNFTEKELNQFLDTLPGGAPRKGRDPHAPKPED